ncbi:hypothetical protein G9P44_000595 [Scheffersomyces stipitis]|nr:hypothetical protein G9P44_000595 [Scheffersomyces stipitis]
MSGRRRYSNDRDGTKRQKLESKNARFHSNNQPNKQTNDKSASSVRLGAVSSSEAGVSSQASSEGKGGLNVEIHPLLRATVLTPALPKNHNPLSQNVRKWFDPFAINPYLKQTDSSVPQHKPRQLVFNPKGRYIAQGDALREKIALEQQQKKELEEKKARGLAPDESLGEQLYKPEHPPSLEWWDKPFVLDRDYSQIEDSTRLNLNDEEQPVSIYIQHPVFIPPPWEKLNPEAKPMYLTKKERKRIRKNERSEKHKDKQDRIKLGLDAPPPPKVKLSNLMNILTNEAIKDPTAIEMRVRQEVEERLQNHLATNEARKLTKEQRHEKIQEQREKDLSKGYFTSVYRVDNLSNPQHFFKVNKNAQQLDLVGICLRNPKFNLIVVEGGHKSIKFFNKLLTKRIKWTENVVPKHSNESTQELQDLSANKCYLVWEGQVKELSFQKWSVMYSRDEDEAFDVLNRFRIENYWREALVVEN